MADSLTNVFEKFGADILTTDGKILAYLSAQGPTRVKEVMVEVNASYRGFYLAVERLKRDGLVTTLPDQKDKRVRILALTAAQES